MSASQSSIASSPQATYAIDIPSLVLEISGEVFPLNVMICASVSVVSDHMSSTRYNAQLGGENQHA